MLSSAVGISHLLNRRKTKTLNNDSLRLSAAAVVLFAIIQLSWVEVAHCQPFDGSTVDPSEVPVDNPALVEYLTGVVYGRMSNLTTQFVNRNLAKDADFCINDPQLEWDRAFNYSSNLTFVSNCIIKTKGDVTRRICTAKEISLYFSSFNLSSEVSSIPPNMNCNRTFWPAGCEPGWACSVNSDVQVDLTNTQVLPDRKKDCQPCCEGFFCPSGLTCMIPCPLGSYCPLAQLNTNTGACDPYSYQLPLGQTNHTCGGANIWADVGSSGALFCPAGSYCHTNINQRPCSKGNYCPMGSTAEKRCFKLASCDPSTASQNIHAYGVMLIAALTTLLLIVYNFSDQIITIRERRNAQARDAAARTVKANAQARARWKSAKAAIKKHANDVQSQVSQRFSRRKIATGDEMTQILNGEGSSEYDEISTVYPGGIFSASDQASTSSEVKKTVVRREPKDEDLYENSTTFNIEAEDKSVKNKKEKEKTIHSHSQIFRYAYAQLEKEKAQQQQQQQNKNLTFSGVIAMATNIEVRKRPVIEISFRDLTVTLKGQKRHILRSVTGKIKRGRITAVMGPSGAGKTTFLSALAGKAVGCKISGLILINGKAESVHSYKKIVGFVPQDDIVHGNLTVEENLWFSARCRLSSDLPKADKVLTVERVIESLGLQAVRNSLVGTVEKRGISGGQKKRVNVGLELVMEPSLLFLDEPTSGLDSSSSQLLLRALRREALEGVNICMVVHQPSYTLFKSFDELVLLAKGGLTVYHGSVNKVEEYFSSLGIDVPERVNPPDYYIDVLEGMVKPRTSSIASYEELPVRWMYHNGYRVPPDMQKYSGALGPMPAGVTTTPGEDDDIISEDKEARSFARDVWLDVKSNIERQWDMLRHNFLRSKDLSMRKTPNVLLQYKYYLGRLGKQQLRESQMLAVDLFILLIAGACLGSLSKSRDEQFGAPGYINSIIAVSLLCKIAALRSFSLDKLQYWRESASGISSLAHFVAKDTIDQFKTIIKPAVYLSMFFFFNNPRSSFWDNYLVLLCLVYCVTGIAYLLAIFLQPGPSQLLAVLLPVVLTLIVTQSTNNELFKNIQDLCYPKWALEAFVIANAERYYGVWIITRCASLRQRGYNTHDWNLSLAKLILNGLAARIVAFIGMLVFQRK